MEPIINLFAFPVFVLVWTAFGTAAVLAPARLESFWRRTRGLPLIVQALVWLLLLPVMLALWIWHTAWPMLLRLPLVLGLGWVSIYVMVPGR